MASTKFGPLTPKSHDVRMMRCLSAFVYAAQLTMIAGFCSRMTDDTARAFVMSRSDFASAIVSSPRAVSSATRSLPTIPRAPVTIHRFIGGDSSPSARLGMTRGSLTRRDLHFDRRLRRDQLQRVKRVEDSRVFTGGERRHVHEIDES